MALLSILLSLYLLIGLIEALFHYRDIDDTIAKFESDEELEEEDEELLKKIAEANEMTKGSVFIVMFLITLFWLPMRFIDTGGEK